MEVAGRGRGGRAGGVRESERFWLGESASARLYLHNELSLFRRQRVTPEYEYFNVIIRHLSTL